MKPARIMIMIAIVAATLGGCKATAEYQRLAQAGSEYTLGMDTLLTAAGKLRLEMTSEDLLSHKGVQDAYYKKAKADDQRILSLLEKLRAQNQLLTRYFVLLNELATSNAPQQTEQEIGSVADQLKTAGVQLRGDPAAKLEPIQSGVNLLIGGKIRGALRHELEQRQGLIRQEILTQKALLKFLSGMIKENLDVIAAAQEQRLVLSPLEHGKASGDAWITARARVMSMSTRTTELDQATAAAARFGETFDAFVSGQLTQERLNVTLADVTAFHQFAESLNHPTGVNP